jgi:TIR domain
VSRILINYRRRDGQAYAAQLHDWISDRYGADQVFADVDTKPGVDFVGAIERAVQSTDVMLVVIGRGWLVDEEGRRRLDDPDDFVRIEIEAALVSNIRIIPVLVGGASLPTKDDLPSQLAMLNRRQAFELSDTHWRTDLDRLGSNLDLMMGLRSGEENRGRGRSSAPSVSWLHGLAEKLRVRRRR